MALSAAIDFEVRQDGNDLNGGGYKRTAGTTDYSQQAAAQLAPTDLACASNTTLTSATGGFTAAMVGNVVQIASGTHAAAGFYEITAYTSTNQVTIDRTCATGGNMTDGVGKVGGALASLGQIGLIFQVADQATAGMKAYVRGGTYTLGTASANVSGGALDLDASQMAGKLFYLKGYATDAATRNDFTGTMPVINCGAYAPTTVIKIKGAIGHIHLVAYITVDGNSKNVNGFLGNYPGIDNAYLCIAKDCDATYGFGTLYTCRCLATSCNATGFTGGYHVLGMAVSCEVGFSDCVPVFCISYNSSGAGFAIYTSPVIGCISYNATGDGFDIIRGGFVVNCVSYSAGAYDFNVRTANTSLINCASDAAVSGIAPIATFPVIFLNHVTLSADPFTNAAALDFSLNTNANGGALLKSTGASPYGQTGAIDIGSVQHAYPTLPAVANVLYGVDRGDGSAGTFSLPYATSGGSKTGTADATTDSQIVSTATYGVTGSERTGSAAAGGGSVIVVTDD